MGAGGCCAEQLGNCDSIRAMNRDIIRSLFKATKSEQLGHEALIIRGLRIAHSARGLKSGHDQDINRAAGGWIKEATNE